MTETCSFHTHLGAPEMYGEPRLGRGAVPVSVSSPIMHTAGWDSREPPHPPPHTSEPFTPSGKAREFPLQRNRQTPHRTGMSSPWGEGAALRLRPGG